MTPADMQPIISLHNVTAGYDGRAQINGISLNVSRRDFIVVTGPNGSGKTTLLRLMLGLIAPMQGTVSYGRDCTAPEDDCRVTGRRNHVRGQKPRIGYLPQYSAIDRDYPIDVTGTVLSGLNGAKPLFSRITEADRQLAASAISRLGLTGTEHRPISRLSGGELQRVLMARAIVARPDVLMLDEPTTYIDRLSWQRIGGIINELRNDCAIVMVSHDDDFIARFSPTQTLRMENGTITH